MFPRKIPQQMESIPGCLDKVKNPCTVQGIPGRLAGMDHVRIKQMFTLSGFIISDPDCINAAEMDPSKWDITDVYNANSLGITSF